MMDGQVIGGETMKRRVIKKWIKRYITPYIKRLPRTVYWSNEIQVGENRIQVVNNNHMVINGVRVREGEYIPRRCKNLHLNIQQTGAAVKEIVNDHKFVFLRIAPEVRGRDIYIRLITEGESV